MGNAEKCAEQCRIGDKGQEVSIYEGGIVPTALSGAEACGMSSGEKESECS